jgi:CTD nuclear envelope phosphatase 1
VFTASVQEYADPVIDWLEAERKFFTARYYRQHCTFRHGAFIKDLSSIEPDLSKVMILDNSPLSYMFHQGTICPLMVTCSKVKKENEKQNPSANLAVSWCR